MKYIVGNLL